jgi:branched-chain amino acid transport system ATP-binding protein
MQRLLEIDGLHAGYGDADVLHGVGLHVAAGEIVAIAGSNGGGPELLANSEMRRLYLGGSAMQAAKKSAPASTTL